MKKLLCLALVVIIFLTGCDNDLTGYTAVDNKDVQLLINDCATACAKCNPSTLTQPCHEKCKGYYNFGGIEKVEKYTELYSNKCKDSI